MARTVAIVGAGPIGLAAAHGCVKRGLTPVVFERGSVGASLRRFGQTRFFSPLSMNLPQDLLALATDPPPASALLTGGELADLLEGIARSETLAKHVHCKHRVVRVTRHTLARARDAGHPVRAELPFRVVVEACGEERAVEADAVIDASGTYGNPVPLTSVGASLLDGRAIRDLGALEDAKQALAGTRVLLVGHGHSAANALLVLEAIAAAAPETRVAWAVHSRNLRPLETTPGDPLPERARVVGRANELAQKPPPWLKVERSGYVEAYAATGPRIDARLSGGRTITVDHVVALVGYRPDLSIVSELPLEIAPATEGAMRLARALANVTDCLSVPRVAPGDLASGEPGFFLAGAKSYGRARTFLLKTGMAQVATILDGLAQGA